MKIIVWLTALAVGLGTSFLEAAEEMTKPAAMEAAAASINATVESIDHNTRTGTRDGQDGSQLTMGGAPEVARVDQIENGDQVSDDYLLCVAVHGRAPDQQTA